MARSEPAPNSAAICTEPGVFLDPDRNSRTYPGNNDPSQTECKYPLCQSYRILIKSQDCFAHNRAPGAS